jgi:hypothetical protein
LHPRLRCSAWWFGAFAWTLCSPVRPAQACTKVAWTPEPYAVDPSLRALDSTPPSAFSEVTVLAYRSPATICRGQTCTYDTCGDAAAVELSFVPPSDDQTPSSELGFRIELISGEIPQSMLDVMQARPLTPALAFEVGFHEIAALDAVIALVAVDRAGNESAPSAPIHLGYSGCVKPAFEDECIEVVQDDLPACSVSGSAPGHGAALPRCLLPLAALGLLGGLRGLRGRRRNARR